MSRIGNKPIPIPKNVDVQVNGTAVVVTGPLGSLRWGLSPGLDATVENGHVVVTRRSETNKLKALHGLSRAEIANQIIGVENGYTRNLEIMGVGYRAQSQGKTLTFSVGFAHPVSLVLPEGVDVTVDKQTFITLKGIDKRTVSLCAAQIRSLKVPDAYKQKGIKYIGEVLRKKAGKAGKK